MITSELRMAEQEYREFIKTDEGKEWQEQTKQSSRKGNVLGTVEDYIRDFYPELLYD